MRWSCSTSKNGAARVIPRACAIFPKMATALQEEKGEDTVIVEAEGMDTTPETDEDAA